MDSTGQSVENVYDKISEEIAEFRAAPDEEKISEFGDLLFALANVARHLGIDPEDALRATNAKFEKRFRHIELELEKRGKQPKDSDLEEMDALWNAAKEFEKTNPLSLFLHCLAEFCLGLPCRVSIEPDGKFGVAIVMGLAGQNFAVPVQPGQALAISCFDSNFKYHTLFGQAFFHLGQEFINSLAIEGRHKHAIIAALGLGFAGCKGKRIQEVGLVPHLDDLAAAVFVDAEFLKHKTHIVTLRFGFFVADVTHMQR